MDGERFDALTRALAERSSRRSVVRALAGVALGAAAGLLGRGAAADDDDDDDDDRHGPGRSCRKNKDCVAGARCQAGADSRKVCTCTGGRIPCKGRCLPPGRCCNDADCPDDGDPCTTSACGKKNTCRSKPAGDGTPCAADDLCGVDYVCTAGACVTRDPHCPNAINACFQELESCDPATGDCTWKQTCDECFTNPAQPPPPAGQEVLCCPEDRICRSLSGDRNEDQCCYDDEDCVNGACCNKLQHCEDICCNFTCCNGACCAEGLECLFDEPNGGVSCQPTRTCQIDAECNAPEYCTTGFDVDFCCPPERQFQRNGEKQCCDYGTFSGTGRGACCEFPSLCQTYRGTRTRP